MRDRQPTKPGRVLVSPENGAAPYYAVLSRADEPTDPGTPYNKATQLSDETAEILGLDPADDPTVDDAFKAIAGHAIHRVTFHIFSPPGSVISVSGENLIKTIISTGEDDVPVGLAGIYTISRNKNGKTATKKVEVTKEDIGGIVEVVLSWRYGYRKKKAEADPYARIEYLYDAVDMAPAHIDFDMGEFDYGSWADVFFVKKNKPVMLKYDRTVDYELDHNDQTKKLDGTPSDISNTNYDGNAMSALPLGWVCRYEDIEEGIEYEYEIVCEHQWDESYKAFAHTRADGTIADYFYWSMFGGSGNASKIRSLAGQTSAANLTAQNEIDGCKANGDGWYTHTWSQREYIRTLLVLMGKSTNTQAVFGNGNCPGGQAGSVLQTGTLKDKGQFYGYSTNTQQVKVFYIEGFWGDQWDRPAGIINNKGSIYYKMTPEGLGYRINDVEGYTDSGVTITGTIGGQYISATKCGEFGCIPTAFSGAENLYECDTAWSNQTQLNYLLTGASANAAPGLGGAFAFNVFSAPSFASWDLGCGLSAEMPKEE